jgi:hypothetical protein
MFRRSPKQNLSTLVFPGYNLLLRADPVSVVAQTNIGEASA